MSRPLSTTLNAFTVAAVLVTTSACGSSSTPEADAAGGTDDGSPRVALMVASLTTDFFVQIESAAQAYASENDVELSLFTADNDAARELSNMEDILSDDFDVVLLSPVDSTAAVAAVGMANSAGVPVVTFDRGADGGEVVSHIASDNEAGGMMAAGFIAEQFPDGGNVVELQGILSTDVATQRGGGFGAGIEEAGNLEVVAQQSANFDRAQGFTVFENILQANDEVQAVFAHNDEMALGALEAAEAAGREDVLIVGFDASAEAVAAVEEGRMAATVAQLPDMIIETAMDAALAHLAGESVEAQISVDLELVTQ